MSNPKDRPDEFEDVVMGNVDADPINIAREVDELIGEWGMLAPREAYLKAKFFHMAGDEDKASDWLEVKRVVEARLNIQPGSHT